MARNILSDSDRAHHYTHNIWQKLFAEFFGGTFLTFASVGSLLLYLRDGNGISYLGHLVAPALVVVALSLALGNVSGAHFNPIVTLGFFVRGVFSGALVFPYIAAQVIGAVCGTLLVDLAIGDTKYAVIGPKLTIAAAAEMEFILSSLLVIVILSTATRHRVLGDTASFAVGSTLVLCNFLAFNISGASFNPIRSLGPALVNSRFHDLWIYILFPTLGCIFAAILSRVVHWHKHLEEKNAAEGE